MGTGTESRAAQVLLPLATGLLIVGINSAVAAGGAGLLGLMVLLTLGAVLPEHPCGQRRSRRATAGGGRSRRRPRGDGSW